MFRSEPVLLAEAGRGYPWKIPPCFYTGGLAWAQQWLLTGSGQSILLIIIITWLCPSSLCTSHTVISNICLMWCQLVWRWVEVEQVKASSKPALILRPGVHLWENVMVFFISHLFLPSVLWKAISPSEKNTADCLHKTISASQPWDYFKRGCSDSWAENLCSWKLKCLK